MGSMTMPDTSSVGNQGNGRADTLLNGVAHGGELYARVEGDDGGAASKGPQRRGVRARMQDLPLRVRLTLHSLLIMALPLGAATLVGLSSADRLIDEAESRELQRTSDALRSELEANTFRGTTLATGLAITPAIAEAFAQGDRDALAAQVDPAFAELQQRYGIAQVHFHEPPAVSFYRAHQPDEFGDDLASFRQTVVAANSERAVITGLETGRFGLGLRAVVPVEWQGEHVGSVEVGTSFGADFFERFAAANEVDVAFYLLDVGDGFGTGGFSTYASSFGEAPLVSDDVLLAVLGGEVIDDHYERAGSSWAARYEPVTDFAGQPLGVSVVAVPVDEFTGIRTSQALRLVTLAVVLLLIGGLAAWLFARDLSRPLARIQGVLDHVRQGDLSQRLGFERRDEVGAMGQDLDDTLDRLGQLMKEVGANAETLAAAADEMSAVGQQLEANATETSDRAVMATDAAKSVSGNVSSIASASQELGSAVEEIARNANVATDVARRGVVVTDETVAAMDKLGASSAEIDTIVSLISEIAGQTHLLALNANIEAARAGDAGRAFAVVANEIGTLARRTATESETISDRIRSIRGHTAASIDAISAVADTMNQISELQVSIASSVEEQAATTSEIGRSVADAATATSEIADAVESVSEGTDETLQAAGNTASAARELNLLAGHLRTSVSYYTSD